MMVIEDRLHGKSPMFVVERVRLRYLPLILIILFGLAQQALAFEQFAPEVAAPNIVAFDISGGQRYSLTVSEIEMLGLQQVVTTSPWEQGELTFQGVLFRDLLKLAGLDDAEAVLVRAVDNYTQTIPREDWQSGPLLLATRQDGIPLTRRTQGPTRIVYPLKDQPAYDTALRKPRWVWMLASIERVD
ncbi:MAG: molybdopterin-dependent oxidoreductase [Roseitalea sp.]|jgi:hypothetical protein|nr:molybdopterin-dependent oxidoreductase [Roseitalea sp.]MBO6721076.1 molybdopterin-dependent oxidoreductase [Roseitalea sp.]MBO6742852.1 molybdopterin-dependent oxidoreductase [Roseitalea sp.]